jgi:ABC-type phosphate transport system substrate-binding protein
MKLFSKAILATSLAAVTLAAHSAQADVVVIVNAQSATSSLTADDVAQIYLGKSNAMKPVDSSDKATRGEFYTKVTAKDEAQVKAIWSKLVFTGKGTPPKEVATNADVVKAVGSDAKAIGYVDKAAVNSSVKVVYEAK